MNWLEDPAPIGRRMRVEAIVRSMSEQQLRPYAEDALIEMDRLRDANAELTAAKTELESGRLSRTVRHAICAAVVGTGVVSGIVGFALGALL